MPGDEVEPLVDVVAFEKAIGGELAAAGTVSACVGEKNGEALSQKQLRISAHAHAIVGEAMEKNHRVAVVRMRMDRPGAEVTPSVAGTEAASRSEPRAREISCMPVSASGVRGRRAGWKVPSARTMLAAAHRSR